jgi:hypothetical protein
MDGAGDIYAFGISERGRRREHMRELIAKCLRCGREVSREAAELSTRMAGRREDGRDWQGRGVEDAECTGRNVVG